jgi:hypothetical protein
MDHTTMWLAREKTIEARQRAAEIRRARTARSPALRALLHRIRDGH